MKTHLTPTVITNKNGVITTVYKKPFNASTTTTAFPTPAVSVPPAHALTKEQRNALITEAHHRLGTLVQGAFHVGEKEPVPHSDAIRDHMLACSDDAVVALHEYIMLDLSDGSREYYERGVALRTLTKPIPIVTGHGLHEFLTFKASLSVFGSKPNVGTRFMTSLHDYDQLPTMDDYADADEETQRTITALLKITEKLYMHYGDLRTDSSVTPVGSGAIPRSIQSMGLSPQELGIPLQTHPTIRLLGDDIINLILERPDRTDEIANLITRGTSSAPAIGHVLDGSTPAFADGNL